MLGLGIVSLIALLTFLLARAAVTNNEKTRAVGLADAAAKSVATWYAQILNYDAYSNRAIAANEIMIAQAVTLASWTHYAKTISQNIGTIAALMPAVQSLATWIQESAQVSHELAKAGASLEVPLRSSYTRLLQSSQQMMHAAATPFAAQAMVNEVVWSGDARFFGQLIPSSSISAFSAFSGARSGSERTPLASMLQESQDGFSQSRAYDQRLYLMPSLGCIPSGLDSAFGKLIRRGGTWLTPDYASWEAADTLSVHSWRRRSRWSWRCSRLDESIPVGWGAADAQMDGQVSMAGHVAGTQANPSAWSMAQTQAVGIPGYLGLSGYRELVLDADTGRQTASVRVPVLVRLPLSKSQQVTAGRSGLSPSGSVSTSDRLWALSVAELFFQRPKDTFTNPAAREFANLFSPFWASRLVAPTASDQSVGLMIAQGGRL